MTTERNAQGVEWQAVLDECAGFMAQAHPSYDTAEALRAICAAVAELVEADREYDEAREAVTYALGRGRNHLLASARARHTAAVVRRRAALAKFPEPRT